MEISVYLCSLTCAAPTLIYTYRHTLSLHDALPYFAGKQWFEPALLVLVAAVLPQHFHVAGIGRIAIEDFRRQEALAHLLGQWRVFDMGEAGAMLRVRQEQIPQLGRASGRERGGQYVSISVVAVALKKTIKKTNDKTR